MKKATQRFSVVPPSPERRAVEGVLRAAASKSYMHSLLEVDVTPARRLLRELKHSQDGYCSFTGLILGCIARSIARHPQVHACRDIRGRFIVFEDVDVSLTVERTIRGEKAVVPWIIRSAQAKSLPAISREILEARSMELARSRVYTAIQRLGLLPGWLQALLFRLVEGFPRKIKDFAGTVLVTSGGLFARGRAWGVPVATHPVNITLGGLVKDRKPSAQGLEEREFLCLTVSIDHGVVDGAPAARFIHDLKRRIENPSPRELGV